MQKLKQPVSDLPGGQSHYLMQPPASHRSHKNSTTLTAKGTDRVRAMKSHKRDSNFMLADQQ
jgi:hypothetical protein